MSIVLAMVNFRLNTANMKFTNCLVLLATILVGCNSANNKPKKEVTNESSELPSMVQSDQVNFPIYDFNGLEPLLNKKDDKTYIVNFWATWCKPCVEEMPYFEKTFAEQKDNGVEMLLVSLDMPSMWKKRLEPFVKEKNLKGEVVILDDPKMNDWIPKIDEDWQGGIPATLIYNKDNRKFYTHGFTYEELNTELKKFIE